MSFSTASKTIDGTGSITNTGTISITNSRTILAICEYCNYANRFNYKWNYRYEQRIVTSTSATGITGGGGSATWTNDTSATLKLVGIVINRTLNASAPNNAIHYNGSARKL